MLMNGFYKYLLLSDPQIQQKQWYRRKALCMITSDYYQKNPSQSKLEGYAKLVKEIFSTCAIELKAKLHGICTGR